MKIPFVDLVTPHGELEEALVEVFRNCLRSASFVGGPQVEAFEEEFAAFCGTKYCVAVNSGTDALRFALLAAGIGPGDGVITVPNTFIATVEAISQTAAAVAFVDIDPTTYNMDPNQLEDHLRNHFKFVSPSNPTNSSCLRNPKAVVPVDLYGQPADMDAIEEIAERYGLFVIEDACQAHGAQYYSRKHQRWQKAGSMGLAAAFSFYPAKNLGACGEGGAVTTNDPSIATKVRMLRDHGQSKKYYHDFEGYNGRLDSIQAGFLRVKLKYLAPWNEKRRQIASWYSHYFSESLSQGSEGLEDSVVVPVEPEWSKSVYHLYVVRAKRREALQQYLTEQGIGTGLHYPIPLHLQKAYAGSGYSPGMFPVTESVSSEILSLPMFPTLREEQVLFVTQKIRDFYEAHHAEEKSPHEP